VEDQARSGNWPRFFVAETFNIEHSTFNDREYRALGVER
jgi:hypothetical protein